MNALEATLSRLADAGLVPATGTWLAPRTEAISEALRGSVLAQVPAFTDSGNPDVLPDVAAHAGAHAQELARLLGGGIPGDFEFVQQHARQRAVQRFPIEAVLHAYRCGHRVVVHWLREACQALDLAGRASDFADFAFEYTDAISAVASAAYVEQTRLLIDIEGDRRERLLDTLLGGYDESDGRVSRGLRSAGYLDNRQSFCVVVAQPIEPAEMLNPSRAQRLADAIDQSLSTAAARRLIGVRDEQVVAVVSIARRSSGWTAPRASLAATLMPALARIGPAALIGVSNDAPSTSHIPVAHKEATLALEMANAGNRVVQIAGVPVQRLMLQLCGADILRALPDWSEHFLAANRKSGGRLVATLRAYADADMNILRAATQLDIHPNTIYARLQKIQDITGLDARRYRVLNDLLQVADCHAAFGSGTVC